MPEVNSNRPLPPESQRFLKGTSGNPSGRPKGAISEKALTRKIARKQISTPEGKRKSVHEGMLEKLNFLTAIGHPGALDLRAKYLAKCQPRAEEQTGVLLIPALFTSEQQAAVMRNPRFAREPGTYVDYAVEEFLKSARGEFSPFGDAQRAYLRKWGGLNSI